MKKRKERGENTKMEFNKNWFIEQWSLYYKSIMGQNKALSYINFAEICVTKAVKLQTVIKQAKKNLLDIAKRQSQKNAGPQQTRTMQETMNILGIELVEETK